MGPVTSTERGVMGRLYTHRAFERLQLRVQRRVLAVGYVVALLAVPAVALATGVFWPVLVLLVPVVGLCVLVYGAVRGVTELDEGALDERQRRLRSDAFRSSYASAVVIAVLGGFILSRIEDDLPLTAGVAALVAGLAFSLPALVLAWRLPDELADDGVEG